MAKCKKFNSILLGYEDELITEKHKPNVGFWTNKFGGCPDWPVEGIQSPSCRLCGLIQPLVVQIYAPLENSQYHRILYVFSCINPNCWNYNDSWTCLRSQLLDTEYEVTPSTTINNKTTDWCMGADDWDDDNGNFENGNVIKPINQFGPSDNESDDDSSSLSAALGNMNVDEFNANWGGSGAVGKQISPVATAEIEKEESEVVSIDTPTAPQKDLVALLQESAPVPFYLRSGERNQNNSISFIPYFISVGEESNVTYNSDHIKDLIQEYQRHHEEVMHGNIQGMEGCDGGPEDYEKAVPAHGDKMFHHFLSKIHSNPGQILRYSRESNSPLLLYPLQDFPKKCQHCHGELIFEMQLLPTLISKLRFPDEDETRVEFGTVLIFTCKKSCWMSDDKFREEKVIVQMEKT